MNLVNLSAIHASADFSAAQSLKGDELFIVAFGDICKSGDKATFKAAKDAWISRAFDTLKAKAEAHGRTASAEYARTLFYRVLKSAGLEAPGANAGKRVAKVEDLDFSIDALIKAAEGKQWKLAHRILNAMEQMAAAPATETPTAEPETLETAMAAAPATETPTAEPETLETAMAAALATVTV